LFFRKSFLVCSPSGSGKTLIGEVCAVSNIFQGFGKSAFLVPFKALATEKYFHFKKSYERFGIKVVLSIGDYEVNDSELKEADIIVTTYEKMDSILRNFYDKDWIFDISTIIIDEIHIIAEYNRGPRLESLIIRLNEFLHNPQIIGLSATINNPEFFNSWLSSLGNKTFLILSEKRPVPLHYNIEVTQNRDSTIKRLVNKTLSQKGQILVFLNRRKGTQEQASYLTHIVENHLDDSERRACKTLYNSLNKIKGGNPSLLKNVKSGVAFHHAGLLPKERKFIEDFYRKRILKVICCTTTLSAGINTPARVVILKDFRKFITSGYNIKNFSGFHENGDGYSFFKPFLGNEVFQILGRAGRPGLDSEGYGFILVKNIEERMWVEDNYFQNTLGDTFIPKYNDLISGLNKINTLKEQVLLRIYEEKNITIEKLKQFFEKTYFWFAIKDKMKKQNIPIDQLLMIKEINVLNILKLHSNPQRVKELKEQNHAVKISKISNSTIMGHIKTDFGVYSCQFDIQTGITCSCGFKNEASDNYAEQQFSFEFCDHITIFLLYLLELPDKALQKYVRDIIPKSVKNQYILNYLFEKGLVLKNEDDTLRCSHFGKLIIKLYLYPVSGVLIRDKLENGEIQNYKDLIKEAYDILKAENKVRDYKMLEPLIEWTDEEPLDKIVDRFRIMPGDLYSVRDSMERIITFIGIIANYLSSTDITLQTKAANITEMAETLSIRLHHGIKEELFDLVMRIHNVGRVRARILYKAGLHTASQVAKEKPYSLNKKTGLGVNMCKMIIDDANNKKD
jgi:replicative superfamily II helicase